MIFAPINIRPAGLGCTVDDYIRLYSVYFFADGFSICDIHITCKTSWKDAKEVSPHVAFGAENQNIHEMYKKEIFLASLSMSCRPKPREEGWSILTFFRYTFFMTRSKRRRRSRRRRRGSRSLGLEASTIRAIRGMVNVAVGILLFLVLQSEAGMLGITFQKFIVFFGGKWSILLPIFFIVSGVLKWILPEKGLERKQSLGLAFCLFAFLGLMHIGAPLEDVGVRRDELGGAIGFLMSIPFILFLSRPVGYTVLSCLFLVGLFLTFEPNVSTVISLFARAASPHKKTKEEAQKNKKKIPGGLQMKDTRYEEWTFPSYELLDTSRSELKIDDEQLKNQAALIEEKLLEFGIEVKVRDARPGPTVTQFTLQPAEGVKLSRIASLKDDLALALAAQSLRIEAPIPGKSLVGIEMPNSERAYVHLREIMESEAFAQNLSSVTLPLGRDVSGDAIVAGLDSMPHILIAGATNSGKSVCMNTFITSLLYQNAPHELKFILIDPKRVELMPYDGVPHLLTPVITDADKALQAMRWAVAEMSRRLQRFSETGARNIDEYNEKQQNEEQLIPRIVIIIDELADLMMRQYRRDTEMMITRIAQMARAVGIHLIIATQRPSVDVITGLIKANMPTRNSFRTVSSVDSRTILDSVGAEDLLGAGDMLYMTATTPKPVRIQGIYVSTKEVARVINAVKIAGGGKMSEQIRMSNEGEDGEEQVGGLPPGAFQQIDLEADDNGGDELFFEAVRVVQGAGKASASLLQRQLKVGYARAARLLDIMEEKGLIGPADGAKARKVYISVGET